MLINLFICLQYFNCILNCWSEQTWQCLGFSHGSGSVLKDYSWWGTRDHMCYQGSSLDWLTRSLASYPLYSLSRTLYILSIFQVLLLLMFYHLILYGWKVLTLHQLLLIRYRLSHSHAILTGIPREYNWLKKNLQWLALSPGNIPECLFTHIPLPWCGLSLSLLTDISSTQWFSFY